MNVRQLKEFLESVPDDYNVFLADWSERVKNPIEVRTNEIYLDELQHELIFGGISYECS